MARELNLEQVKIYLSGNRKQQIKGPAGELIRLKCSVMELYVWHFPENAI